VSHCLCGPAGVGMLGGSLVSSSLGGVPWVGFCYLQPMIAHPEPEALPRVWRVVVLVLIRV
jgi:hypothetical protein